MVNLIIHKYYQIRNIELYKINYNIHFLLVNLFLFFFYSNVEITLITL
jgi:hypothetical protein